MKTKNILIIILIALLSFNVGYFTSTSTLYSSTGIVASVTETETETFEITFVTANGHKWYFYSEDPDWFVNDIISVTFTNKGTQDITDDEIIATRYSGTIEMFGGIKNEN